MGEGNWRSKWFEDHDYNMAGCHTYFYVDKWSTEEMRQREKERREAEEDDSPEVSDDRLVSQYNEDDWNSVIFEVGFGLLGERVSVFLGEDWEPREPRLGIKESFIKSKQPGRSGGFYVGQDTNGVQGWVIDDRDRYVVFLVHPKPYYSLEQGELSMMDDNTQAWDRLLKKTVMVVGASVLRAEQRVQRHLHEVGRRMMIRTSCWTSSSVEVDLSVPVAPAWMKGKTVWQDTEGRAYMRVMTWLGEVAIKAETAEGAHEWRTPAGRLVAQSEMYKKKHVGSLIRLLV